jgi:hypothetical protein
MWEERLLIYLTWGSLFIWLTINEYRRITCELKQLKKHSMNIEDIKFEKEKLQTVIEVAIKGFERKTGCNVSISSDITEDAYRTNTGIAIQSETKIHIDVLL